MKTITSLFLCLAGLFVKIDSQAFPYISFMGQTLANNSYVELKFVGNDSNGYNSLKCHTDLGTCCSQAQGFHRGDWYYPNGSRLQFRSGFFEARSDQVVVLRKLTGIVMPSGIYRCDIPTAEVHDDSDGSVRESVYVGLYSNGGI